ncbi:MAG: hydroxylamine reductase [Coriobacteriales bacterium]|jgi:hydroxylamine reductase|nr:hydroxylamine reductase [Coriobacteriales bacterium]
MSQTTDGKAGVVTAGTDDAMFCYQCEQVAGNTACTGSAGVCGKSSVVARLQDRLTGALIGLAQGLKNEAPCDHATRIFVDGLFITGTNVNFSEAAIQAQLDATMKLYTHQRQQDSRPYTMEALWNEQEDIRSLKTLVLLGVRGIAAYAHHAAALGRHDASVDRFFSQALAGIADASSTSADLLELAMQTGQINLKVMELLDTAHNDSYSAPQPTVVSQSVEAGPFIVISGHDLHDLKMLLEQTVGRGVNVYTHGEMLPAHAYPELNRFGQLKGNFGTAWQNQRQEFAHLPAPVLFTTNCLMPPAANYADRVYTTSVVGHADLIHIPTQVDGSKDFSALIARAKELGGYATDTLVPGTNGGTTVLTGFGHAAVLAQADTVIAAVKSGAIRHLFLVGGCDGAKPGRNYFTRFVEQAPADTVILTLACGKFRFNDLDLGTIGGLPRIMDMGQCNDAYSAIKVAAALAEAFGCGINDLPLTLVLSWYEQKAVAILLTLLSLGVKNILLGPSLPAFVSPAILKVLVENFSLAPITTPEEDLRRILGLAR